MRKFARVSSLVLCLLIIAGAARGQEAEAIFARAVEAHQSGNLEGAVKEYEAYLAVRPQSLEARSNLGAAYAGLGRYREAISQYRRALDLDPRHAGVRFNLGVALYKAAQISEAAAEFAQVAAAEPGNYKATLLLADCYLRLGEHKKVIDLLGPLETARPDDRAVAYLLGTALLHDKQVERGQRVIDRILRDGETAEAKLLLGTAQLMARDYTGATRDLARAIELNPKLPSVNSYYGRALLETGNPAQAMAAFRRELEVNPQDFESNLYVGVLLKQEQKNEESLRYFARALDVRPGAIDVRYQIGTALFALGKLDEARQTLEEVVKDASNFVEAHVTLATIYYRLKRKEEGDRHRAIVQKLNAEAQARAPGAQPSPPPPQSAPAGAERPAGAAPQP